MDIIKSFSRRSLAWTFFIVFILAIFFNLAGYFGWQFFTSVLPLSVIDEVSVHSEAFKNGIMQLMPIAVLLKKLYIPIVTGVFIFFGLLLWIILKSSIAKLVNKTGLDDGKKAEKSKKDHPTKDIEKISAFEKKEIAEKNKRFYLHLLSVLQREGRLIDFFSEDLSQYDDAQIGAAVRSIQENSKKSLKKYLNPKPVIDKSEGEQVLVEPGFDPGSIKLTGNVTGEPPFEGVLRHKGWRAAKLELPTLSATHDSSIIAPAEVEIL
jgi:hypothetical protein